MAKPVVAVDDLTRGVVAAGLSWIYNTVQPDGVLDQHHGVTRGAGDRIYHFVPDERGPIAVLNVAKPTYTDRGAITNPLTGADVVQFESLLVELGYSPVDRWNGVGTSTFSVRLAGSAHPTLLAAVAKYHRGCPDHATVFCGRQNGCSWFTDGRAGLIPPVWPKVPTAATTTEGKAIDG